MPYIFGCTVIVLRDKDDRGEHGSLTRGRTFLAKYLGREGAGHVVEKHDTRAIVYPSHVIPINEAEFVRDAMPPSAALHTTDTQTVARDMPRASPPHAPAGASNLTGPQSPSSSLRLQAQGDDDALQRIIDSDVLGGDDVSLLLLYGGHEETIDNIKRRVNLRAPRARVTIIDIKGDPVGQDMKLRENRVAVLKDLSDMKYTVVIAAHPCTTYGHCIGVQMRGKSKDTIWGLTGLEPSIMELVKEHNILSTFTQRVIDFCADKHIPWGVECSPDRSDSGTDAYWSEYAHFGCFWDHASPQQWKKKHKAKSYLVARCHGEYPPTAQKYYQFMLSVELQPAGDEELDHMLCLHTWHPTEVRGRNEQGFWISQQLEEYTPVICDKVAIVALSTSASFKGKPTPDAPPFSDEKRGVNYPAGMSPLTSQVMPPQSSMADLDDALLATDGTYSDELDAALAGVLL